jgi:hypothetical protein
MKVSGVLFSAGLEQGGAGCEGRECLEICDVLPPKK